MTSKTKRDEPTQISEDAVDEGLTQSERFIKAAQELGTDDNLERFKEWVRKIAKNERASDRNPDFDDA